MSKYLFVVGVKQDNFTSLEEYREGILKLHTEYERSISIGVDEDGPTGPFDADVIVVAINQRGKEPVRGFARLSVLKDGHGELESAFVRPEDRRRKLWDSMIDILVRKADKMGIKDLMAYPVMGDEFLEEPLRTKGFSKEGEEADMWRRL